MESGRAPSQQASPKLVGPSSKPSAPRERLSKRPSGLQPARRWQVRRRSGAVIPLHLKHLDRCQAPRPRTGSKSANCSPPPHAAADRLKHVEALAPLKERPSGIPRGRETAGQSGGGGVIKPRPSNRMTPLRSTPAPPRGATCSAQHRTTVAASPPLRSFLQPRQPPLLSRSRRLLCASRLSPRSWRPPPPAPSRA